VRLRARSRSTKGIVAAAVSILSIAYYFLSNQMTSRVSARRRARLRAGRNNLYSAPAPPGKTGEVRLYSSHVEIRDEGRAMARHERCYERHQQPLDLEHYLDVLERKPGALIGSKPLAAWRTRGLRQVMIGCWRRLSSDTVKRSALAR
jgi:hypothetical protein